ncbi:MAG: FAD binding domain-containing protein [Spirochaetales bacterium]|nr:FAD binding domain-containing protein [Spirochaetales bacterium]
MPGRDAKIYYPASLGELHNLIKTEGTGTFYSGRMYPEKEETPGRYYNLAEELISLDGVEELKRINRSETYIDCGSAVPFTALFNKAGHILPSILMKTVRKAYNPAQLCLTTPAGLLYSGKIPTPVSLLFNVMEVSYEIRRLKTHRWRGISAVNHWIYHNQLFKNGEIDLKEGDVVMRIRLPSNTWGQARIERIQLGKTPLYLAMTSQINRNYISNFRFSYALEGGELFRERDREAHISGRNMGSASRETELISKKAAEKLGFEGNEKLIRAIFNSLGNFLYQSGESGA